MALGTTITVGFNSSAVHAGFKKISEGFKGMTRGFANAGRAMLAPFVKLMAIMAPLLGAAAVFKLGKDSLAAAANYETMALKMEQFTGSAEKAKAILDEMTDFSLKTPFETKDLQEAAAAFLGAGIKDGIPKLVKDVAAVAKDGGQILELTDALSKGFAKGKFQTEEINKFLERGINLLPELRNVTGLQGKEFQKAVEAGLKFEDVTKAVGNLSKEGGLFYGMLEKQSQTTIGLVSTLMSGFTELQKVFGQPINDAIKPIIADAISNVSKFLPKVQALGETVAGAIKSAFNQFQNGTLGELIWVSLEYVGSKFGEFMLSVMDFAVQRLISRLAETDIGRLIGFQAKSSNFGRFQELNEGAFGSVEKGNALATMAAQPRLMEVENWLKIQHYTDKEILSVLKQQYQYTRNTLPSIPR
jgi:tape measure domain-containing protein